MGSVKSISKTEQRLIVQTPHRCRLAALIMMLTGLRTGELLALSWSDIDLDSKRLNVCKHAVKTSPNCYQIMPGTKTGKTRFVNIPDNMCIYLRSEMKNAKSPIVFPKTDGSYNTPSSWSSAWKSYMNTINHYYSDSGASKFNPHGYPKLIHINPHQLRHTYATLLYVSGTDALIASKLMGHSSVQITLDIYTHLAEEFKSLDISNFNCYLNSDLCQNEIFS